MLHASDLARRDRDTRIAANFKDWLNHSGDVLIDAAGLLGGPRWSAEAVDVIDAVANGRRLTDLLPRLRKLLRLLHLELVDEPGSLEAALFSCIHPDDPRADDARLCAETLDEGVTVIESLEQLQVPPSLAWQTA